MRGSGGTAAPGTMKFTADLERKITELTPELVAAAVRKHLHPQDLVIVAAGDFKKPKPFPTFTDGHDEVLLCEKILESHKGKKWVNI